MDNVEVEIKYIVTEPKKVKSILDAVAKKKKIDEPHVDTYFRLKDSDFILRIRKYPHQYFLTYIKRKAKYAAVYHSTPIAHYDSTRKILESIGAKHFLSLKKNRSSWLFKDVEFVVDHIRGEGYFLEIEALKNKKTVGATVKYLKLIMKEINFPGVESISSGYISLLGSGKDGRKLNQPRFI